MLGSQSIIIPERRKFYREKFPVFIHQTLRIQIGHFIHVFSNFCSERQVFVFCILFIKNTILLFLQPYTAKAVRTAEKMYRVLGIFTSGPAIPGKLIVVRVFTAFYNFVAEL